MKTRISADGPLVVSQEYFYPLGGAVGFALFVGMLDVGFLVLAFYGGPDSAGAVDGMLLLLANLLACGFLVWALWFVPMQVKFVISTERILIVNRSPFRSRDASYLMADVDHFDVRYFERYRETKMGAMIEMYLRSGAIVAVMRLPSVNLCETALTAMNAWFSANSHGDLLARRSVS